MTCNLERKKYYPLIDVLYLSFHITQLSMFVFLEVTSVSGIVQVRRTFLLNTQGNFIKIHTTKNNKYFEGANIKFVHHA